jgi:hypothetical protein
MIIRNLGNLLKTQPQWSNLWNGLTIKYMAWYDSILTVYGSIPVQVFWALLIIIIFLAIELINRYRYYKFFQLIKSNKNRSMIFTEVHKNDMICYSKFMKKNILNDNFFDIFRSYYPDSTISQDRIRKVIGLYIYDIDPTSNSQFIVHDMNIPIPVHQTINYLTKKFEKMYITSTQSDQSVQAYDWTDLTKEFPYKSSYQITIEWFRYIMFMLWMFSCRFKHINISNNIRIWICGDHENGDHENRDLVLIDERHINKRSLGLKDNNIYVEMKGFTSYSVFFDMMTCDIFNDYPTLDTLAREFNGIFNMVDTKINICCSNINSIIIPHLSYYFHERINMINTVDPVYYPYSYHMMFRGIKNRLHKNKNNNTNFIFIFNRLALIDIYFGRNTDDLVDNKLYSKNVRINFSRNANKYIDKERVELLLDMFSRTTVS